MCLCVEVKKQSFVRIVICQKCLHGASKTSKWIYYGKETAIVWFYILDGVRRSYYRKPLFKIGGFPKKGESQNLQFPHFPSMVSQKLLAFSWYPQIGCYFVTSSCHLFSRFASFFSPFLSLSTVRMVWWLMNILRTMLGDVRNSCSIMLVDRMNTCNEGCCIINSLEGSK